MGHKLHQSSDLYQARGKKMCLKTVLNFESMLEMFNFIPETAGTCCLLTSVLLSGINSFIFLYFMVI